MKHYTPYLAQTSNNNYSCDAYGESAFGECAVQGTTTETTGGGQLANTGLDVLAPLTIGAAMILAAAGLGIRMIIAKRKQSKTN